MEDTSNVVTGHDREQNLRRKFVYVVVLGDIGRSPRMRYHALSLTNNGYFVQIIGYQGTDVPNNLTHNPRIFIRPIREPPALVQELPKSLSLLLKFVWLTIVLSWAFVWSSISNGFHPDFILVQNPPAIPTLSVCWLMSRVYKCPFVVDWHNYGFSILALALKTSRQSLIVRLAEGFENFFGAKADYSITVTKAMAQDLNYRLGINAVTLYDRPPAIFKSLTEHERLTFLTELSNEYPVIASILDGKALGSGRPGILISCTSWTEDEDFDILLNALQTYEAEVKLSEVKGHGLSDLIVFITGKGPNKSYYSTLIDSLAFKHVHIYLPWLSHNDYPKLLACADLGVSLHTSSSGLDLPMKVVDMFGCGLPVAAIHFKCISELVRHEENGLIFKTSDDLSQYLQQWFQVSSTPNRRNDLFRHNLKAFQALRWNENWNTELSHIFPKESTH